MISTDRYKRLIKFAFAIVILTTEVAIYYCFWAFYWNKMMQAPFWRRGNWLLVGLYGVVLYSLLNIYGGLKIGYLKRGSLIYSQIFAVIFANIFGYIELILLDKKIHSILSFIILTGINILTLVLYVFVFQWIYNRLFPPRTLLAIYGEKPIYNILDKINSRDDKYVLAGAININKGIDKIIEEAGKYGGVIIGDIPSHERNKILKECYNKSIRAYLAPKISDILVKSSTDLNLFDAPLLLSRNEGLQMDQVIAKRIEDIVFSLILLIISSPLFLIFAIAIKMTDGGPVFYKQKRLTKYGEVFDILKFRTMKVDAEKESGVTLSEKGDSRVTKVGKLLRSCRLDELPQLINILMGQMSLVGPRPERPEIAAEYEKEIPEFSFRLRVKAGLTGYAQVYGKYNTTPYDKLKMDLMYIRNFSILLDLKIILMTPKILFIKEATEGIEEGAITASLKEAVYGKINISDSHDI